jgi:hypothetical protein
MHLFFLPLLINFFNNIGFCPCHSFFWDIHCMESKWHKKEGGITACLEKNKINVTGVTQAMVLVAAIRVAMAMAVTVEAAAALLL